MRRLPVRSQLRITSEQGDNNGWNGDVWFTLAGNTDRIGIGIADSQGTVETIYAYDASLNLLESFVVPSCSNCWHGFDRAFADIAYFRLSGGFFAFDNLVYNAVPEPATIGLLSLGLVAAGMRRHRRQQKSR